ncbi:MAG: KamA family radical SAM protein [Candidatus Aminicenantes bacterium]|nr:KamA family radical SAM protein [Candidatus Aminicenantes bacterium]
MNQGRNFKKLQNILSISPPLKKIFMTKDSVEEKRKRIREFLTQLFNETFGVSKSIHPMEYILRRDAITTFRKVLMKRNEDLSGFSFLQYINNLIHDPENKELETPNPGFFAEIEHLLKGIMGKTGIYPEKAPSFAKYEGIKAARLRSADLSRLAHHAYEFINSYPCGLDADIKKRNIANKTRILKYFGATELEWENWKWHTRHIIRNAKTLRALIKLTEEEYKAVSIAEKSKIPFGITPYYLSLMDNDPENINAYVVRAQVIPSLHYVNSMLEYRESSETSMDFMLERDTSPIEGITRRYPMIAILKPILTCPQICVYCQRNWEIEDVYSLKAVLSKEKLEKAINWIAETPELNEILITGGDPFLLTNHKIEHMLFKLSRIPHIKRIRLGTRTPITLPQRITDSLVRDINHFHHPGKREILIVTHVEHPLEVTPEVMNAVQKFRRSGMDVYNQMVYTFYNSRKFEAVALRDKLRLIGVNPYYTFNTKGKEETYDFRVPIPRLLQEQKEEARLVPGTVRTDEIVFNVPKLGKNYLRATQHHDVISILPSGCRVYEFHPWEKKLALANTYVYTDVSVYDYLQRLKSIGEDLQDYKTIWYYY